MKKVVSVLSALLLLSGAVFGQDFSEEDLFGGSDDDLFGDDGIEEMAPAAEESQVKTDLRKGVLFETGSIKIGGNFTTQIETSTKIFADDDKNFGEHIYDTTLTPAASAYLTVDARPNQNLRMYTKFGMAYPFKDSITSYMYASDLDNAIKIYEAAVLAGIDASKLPVTGISSVTNWFKIKELFTDFSVADRAFFRFGLHTVTWGTGYFFSPVSDLINTSSINPEDTDAQVDGCLNLRTQITFPGSQNCLWLYVIPSDDYLNSTSLASYAKDTALAGKVDLVFGGWEIGAGGFWKYEAAPKVMATASGSLGKVSVFGEALYIYGSDADWKNSSDFEDKTSIFEGTVGASYYWKTPQITVAAQYYYDGNDEDPVHQYFTNGHNFAVMANFGRIFGTEDVTATLFGMMNYGKEEIPDSYMSYSEEYGISSYLNAATISAMLNYSPVEEITISAGPYITFSSYDEAPEAALKFTFTLGGGKF